MKIYVLYSDSVTRMSLLYSVTRMSWLYVGNEEAKIAEQKSFFAEERGRVASESLT